MKKTIFIVPLVVLAVLAFEYLKSPKVEVDGSVRPYLEKCLDFIIKKDHKIVYETYLRECTVTFDEFDTRMNYFSNIFGAAPESFSYLRSYVGGVGYFIQYNLVLADGQSQSCTFSFPAEDGRVIAIEDLESMSVFADFGEKQYSVDFESGKILACKAPEGCYGED